MTVGAATECRPNLSQHGRMGRPRSAAPTIIQVDAVIEVIKCGFH